MYISKIIVDGYKTLYDFELHNLNQGLNVFIGENNVGKSNILKVLDIFFNKDVINDSDRTILLDYVIGKSTVKELRIEIEFSENIPLNRTGNTPERNKKRVIARFNQNNKKQFLYYHNNDNIKSVEQTELFKFMPHYIYIGDLNEKEFSIDTLFKSFPNLSDDNVMNIETYANNFLKNSWRKSLVVSIKSLSENIIVIVTDEFGNTNRFEEKSSGIQQLVFMALFLGLNLTTKINNIIIGLEEPEANLHLKLQKQLFALLRMISKNVQILISTHSASFVDTMYSKEIFHIIRNDKGQSLINTNVMHDNWHSLRMDLGLSINDSLLFGQNNLIVEGITEKILLPFLIDKLHRKDKIQYSNSDINVVSSEGASNASYFLRLISELDLNNLVLLDKDKAGDVAQKDIKKNMPIFKNNIIRLEKENYKEIEFEDLFSDEIISEALSKVYGIDVLVEDIQNARGESNYLKFSDMIEKLESNKNTSVKFVNIGKHKFARNIRHIIEIKSEFELPYEIINLCNQIGNKVKSINGGINE